MWDLVVFGVIGLLVGAAARVVYPGRETTKVLGTMVLGLIGSLIGGLISRATWPSVGEQLHFGALLTSLIGAVLALAAWAVVGFLRRSKAARNMIP
jgi:uncharacterized membrane protein YeaQ/YmgE (transglycosylase-associated protein family)